MKELSFLFISYTRVYVLNKLLQLIFFYYFVFFLFLISAFLIFNSHCLLFCFSLKEKCCWCTQNYLWDVWWKCYRMCEL